MRNRALQRAALAVGAIACFACQERLPSNRPVPRADGDATGGQSSFLRSADAPPGGTIGLGDLTPAFGPGWSRPQPCDLHPLRPTVTIPMIGGQKWIRDDLIPAIRARVNRRLTNLRECYLRELAVRPKLCGQIGAHSLGFLSEKAIKVDVENPAVSELPLAGCATRSLKGAFDGIPFASAKHRSKYDSAYEFTVYLDFSTP